MTSIEKTIGIEQTEWKVPAWAEGRTESDGGLHYSFIPPTVPLEETAALADDPEPIKIELMASDYLTVVNSQVTVRREPIIVLVGDMTLTVPEAQKLRTALGEVLDAAGPWEPDTEEIEGRSERVSGGEL